MTEQENNLYSVSLVFTKNNHNGSINIAQIARTIWALSENDAFGLVYDEAKKGDLKDHELFSKISYCIPPEIYLRYINSKPQP